MHDRAVAKVKRQLWAWGFSAKRPYASPGISYDILVEGEVRVRVFVDRKNLQEAIQSGMEVSGCDILAIVYGGKIEYRTFDGVEAKTPRMIFRRKEGGL